MHTVSVCQTNGTTAVNLTNCTREHDVLCIHGAPFPELFEVAILDISDRLPSNTADDTRDKGNILSGKQIENDVRGRQSHF